VLVSASVGRIDGSPTGAMPPFTVLYEAELVPQLMYVGRAWRVGVTLKSGGRYAIKVILECDAPAYATNVAEVRRGGER
jgi:hypothetical protein